MPVVPGTKVSAAFFTFGSTPPPKPSDPMEYPPIYYGSGEGTLPMASVNAGNSQSLEVGLGGVNRAFASALGTGPGGAGQKNVNSGSDNYQTRHNKLLANAGSGATASESYSMDDPCAFSFVQASLVNRKSGWYEGVCFVDVFSGKLCPAGNALNAAMIYAAPPYGDNYASDADFLAAIQATAVNIIRAIAGYNAIAKKQNLPLIQALRNTLFSSALYNRSKANVDPDKIARAIFAGFQSELQAQDAGLLELQFPVGRGAQGRLFGPVEDDLTQAGQGAAVNRGRAPMAGMMPGGKGSKSAREEHDDDGDGVEMRSAADQRGSDTALGQVIVDAKSGQSGQKEITNENAQFKAATAGGAPLGNYDVLPANPNKPVNAAKNDYEQTGDLLDGPSQPVQGAGQAVQSDDDVVMTHRTGESRNDQEASESSSENDQQGYSTCCKVVTGIAIAGTLGSVAGTLVWAFAFGGATKNADSGMGTTTPGAGKLKTDDQTATANDLDATVDVDLPSLNGLMMIDNITFSAPMFTPPPAKGAGGSWSMTPSIHALFTPDDGEVGAFSSISVQYVLEATIQGSKVKSDAKMLTVNFNPSAAVDINATATDRKSTLPIDVSSAYKNFAGTIQLKTTTGGTWINDPTNNKIVDYTPDSTPQGTTATAQYVRVTTWGAPSTNFATITVTLPAAVNPQQPTGTAEFLANDTTTQGDWLHVYGADGYLIAGDQNSNPAYVTPALSTQAVSSLSSTKAAVALVKASDPTKTVAAAWSGTSPITIDLACNDTTTVHQAALYFADYDPKAAGQVVEVVDANGTRLATQTLPATLTGGLYLVCNISGHVRVQISNAAGNAVLSGVFFGGPVVSATFVKSDSKTQGTWQGVYGADGYTIAGDTTKNPSYVSPSIDTLSSSSPQTPFVQAASTTEVRALQKTSKPTDREAATWYADARGGSDAILIDLPFSGSAVHQVAIYCLDWDNSGIVQTVDVLDASGYVLDTQSLSSFGNGIWLIWKIMGRVRIRIRNSAGDNGTVSGVFFDPAGTTMFASFSAAPVAWDFTVWMTDAPQSVKVDFLKRCQIPAGFRSIELSNGTGDVTVPKQGRWFLESTGSPATVDVVFQPEPGLLLGQGYSMKYRVVDQKGVKSNEATMTVDYSPLALMMPRAGNFLSSADARYGKFAAADVLPGCSAAFGIAKGTVKLMGLKDILQGNPLPQVYLRNDNKSMCVVGEGIWMVDDNGLIVFQSDPTLSTPPTPARFCFTDNKGYQSNVAVVVFDSGLTDAIAQVPPALSRMTDADFWQNYAANVTQAQQDPLPEQFVAITQTLAVITRTLGSVGPEPDFDFDTNFNKWKGGSWADLQTMCAKMVASAVGSTAPRYAARYWQLNLMVRMALKAYPPS
jgi:hypothetical protein